MNAWIGLKAVYDKEMLTYFRSPIAYFVIAVFLLGTGYFFTYNIFLTGWARWIRRCRTWASCSSRSARC